MNRGRCTSLFLVLFGFEGTVLSRLQRMKFRASGLKFSGGPGRVVDVAVKATETRRRPRCRVVGVAMERGGGAGDRRGSAAELDVEAGAVLEALRERRDPGAAKVDVAKARERREGLGHLPDAVAHEVQDLQGVEPQHGIGHPREPVAREGEARHDGQAPLGGREPVVTAARPVDREFAPARPAP